MPTSTWSRCEALPLIGWIFYFCRRSVHAGAWGWWGWGVAEGAVRQPTASRDASCITSPASLPLLCCLAACTRRRMPQRPSTPTAPPPPEPAPLA